MIRKALFCLAFWPWIAEAQTLSFPGNAEMTARDDVGLDSYAMPVGPWVDGHLPTTVVEGDLTRQAWRIDASGITSLQLLRPLREQLRNDGFDVTYSCETDECGGFDFRFAMDVLRPPAMQVNLGDYRYLAATKDDTAISLLVSRTSDAGFVHVTRVGPPVEDIAKAAAPAVRAVGQDQTGDLATGLETTGRAVLHGLAFQTGSSQLGEGQFDALQDLADYLADRPELTVALVGHTDSSGSLEGNIALSKRRAGSVLERLVTDYDVNRQQLEAQGNGYLSPIASNRTEVGRDANRRVEVIVTSVE